MTRGAPGRGGVDVVIPYYRDQRMLDRILAALSGQTGFARCGADGGSGELSGGLSGGLPGDQPGDLSGGRSGGLPGGRVLRVIVADDGSPTPPTVPPDVTVVRQEDRGFRASAARHLGARAGEGELLLFLDGDTVPGPGYVAAMCEALEGHPDLLVVGRRRYGRFAESATAVEPVEVLPDPAWPAGYYAETADLTEGEDLWRGVLSAVCGLHRRLYDLAGGFDPDIVGYGGEDWDLAWRCEQTGGRLRYVPGAVAWHDGPDWSGRAGADGDRDAADHLAQKNAETARLAPLIASPLTRPAGGIYPLPSIAVHVHAADPAFGGSGAAAATCASLLAWGDVAVTVDPATPDAALIAELVGHDPRVELRPRGSWWRPGTPGVGPRRRPPVLVDVHRPCALGGLDPRRVRALCPPLGGAALDDDEGRTLAYLRSSRALAREQDWGDRPPAARSIRASGLGVRALGADGEGVRLERIIGGW